MRDYASIAEALRCCRYASERGCAECPYRLNNNEKCAHLLNDAADAIEELRFEKRLLESNNALQAQIIQHMKTVMRANGLPAPQKEDADA